MIKHTQNPHLDGLRGIAILLVIGYHYFTGFYIFDFGWSGVDLFFVLSGYLLSGRIIPYLEDKTIIWKFYFNRILRIVPLYFTFLITFYVLIYSFGSYETQNINAQLNHPIYFFTFLSNWDFILDYDPIQHHLSHLWSLAVEEQFYLLFPIYVITIKDKKLLKISTIVLLILVVLIRCSNYLFENNYEYIKITWNTLYRLDCFLIGLLIYLLEDLNFFNLKNKWINLLFYVSVLGIIIGSIIENTIRISTFFTTVGFSLVAIAYGCLIIFATDDRKNFLKKITLNPVLIFFGRVSFGLYIFHWPIYLMMFKITNFCLNIIELVLNSTNVQLVNITLSFIVTTVISYLSFKYYESYFLKWKIKPSQINTLT